MAPPRSELDIVLSTERLFLRRFTSADARLLYELDSDPEVMRFITRGEPTPLTEIEQDILPRILSYYLRTPTQGCWAAHLRSNGQFIGWFQLRADKISPDEMELGYRLERNAWGQGLATEGSRALMEKGFRDWAVSKISARTLVQNLASQRVIIKAGLRFQEEFYYRPDVLPGWPESERRAVKYGLRGEEFISCSGRI